MNILIADDHELFSGLLKKILEDTDPTIKVQTFRNFTDAFNAVGTRKIGEESTYKLIILDMNMPGMDGVASIRRMQGIADGAPIAIISGLLTDAEAREVMRNGAAGFIPKTISLTEMREALSTLLAGGRYVPKLSGRPRSAVAPAAVPDVASAQPMTSRERAVLSEVIQGWSNKRIAQNLGITEMTVKTHLFRVFKKLGAKNRTDAVRIALQTASIGSEPPSQGDSAIPS